MPPDPNFIRVSEAAFCKKKSQILSKHVMRDLGASVLSGGPMISSLWLYCVIGTFRQLRCLMSAVSDLTATIIRTLSGPFTHIRIREMLPFSWLPGSDNVSNYLEDNHYSFCSCKACSNKSERCIHVFISSSRSNPLPVWTALFSSLALGIDKFRYAQIQMLWFVLLS